MANMPGFIAVETGDDGGLPLAIAWTLPDGRVKHTRIQPEDDWLDAEMVSLGEYSLEELISMGVSPLDVIRELENDHFSDTLYTAGVGDDEAALSRLFDTYGLDPFVELAPAESLYATLSPGERSEEHTSELQSRPQVVCRLLLEKKKQINKGVAESMLLHNLIYG